MKILITGGAGFIGSNFVHFWTRRHPGDKITVLDMLTYAGDKKNLDGVLDKIEFVQGDICDKIIVSKLMADADIVVHFAAETHVDRSILGPEEFVRTNVYGTFVLLEAARAAHIKRFHHISTDEVFGSAESDKFTESTKYDPSSPYSASKAGSDHLANAYYRTFKLPVTVSNCSNNFGPRQFPEKLIPLAITNLLAGKKVPVYGDGRQVRDWLYVEDHCRAIELILEKGRIGETYLVGAQHGEITNLEVVKTIVRLMGFGDGMIEFVADRPGHDVRYAVDWSKLKNELGYEPQFGFEENLKKTIEWYAARQHK